MPMPFAGEPFTFVQPDGSEVQLLGWGNQFEAVFETVEGYTVVQDAESGYYHFATLSDDKTALLPTGPRVGTVDPTRLSIAKHLRTRREATRMRAMAAMTAMAAAPGTEQRWEVRRRQRRAQLAATRSATAGAPAPPQPTAVGNVMGLCLLIQFPDVPGTITPAEVTNFCNQPGYTGFGNNGSVLDYFLDVSDGALNYTNAVTAYYTAQHNRAHYTDPAIPYGTRAQELIHEALLDLQGNGFNFAQLSSDGAGFVYALNVFYAGPRVNAWSQGLWPHAWTLATPFAASATKTLGDYQITDMGAQLTLRTFCHENGHMVCDFGDMYDYGGESGGAGHYCLMCFGGNDLNPTEVSAYLKNEAGWSTSLTTLTPGASVSLGAGTNDFAIHAKNATEYFIMENRQKIARDTALPDAGLLIWHVDEFGSNSNEQMTAAQHYELSLEQADGRFDLEHGANSGDSDDCYGAPGIVAFGDATIPSSKWWDGTSSGLEIIDVSAPGAVVTIKTKNTAPVLVIPNFGATAGGWRVDRHPRFVVDTTNDGRADIVGFGDAGVWISRAQADGTYGPLQRVIDNFAYSAGGWRVDRHPRFVADTTGDGRVDIGGFGEAGVWISRQQADGTYGSLQRVVDNFGYSAGGWRVERHPRFVVDMNGDGRADIVGFGNAGVWIARAQAGGTYAPLQRVVDNFGYDAGGWRVERHPRLLADTTGDGRLDIVGFGEAGVWISRQRANGTFAPLELAVSNFGYSAGGWRVDRHPRFVVDMNGDGRADIVGFGNAGVWIARAQAGGTYAPLERVVDNFGYDAGGWRVERHPRLLADTTGDGRLDIVGFGYDGVWISYQQPDGTFTAPELAVTNFGYNAGGWRVDRHPRFLADTTGAGRADVVGFGEAGVYLYRW